MMRLGLSSYTYTWAVGVKDKEPEVCLDIKGLIEIAKSKKVNCIQVADNLPLHNLSSNERSEIIHRIKKENLILETGTRGLKPENILCYLDIAREFNSPFLRVVIDAPGFTPGPDEIHGILKELVPELKSRGIKLAIENHDRLKSSEFRDIVEKAGTEWVGICLDTANSLGAGEGIEEVFRNLGPYTINFHIKDIIVKRIWHMMGFEVEGVPAGKGILPIEKLVSQLRVWGKCESCILELWTPQQSTINETIRLESQWADESILFLKSIFELKKPGSGSG